MFYFPSMFLLNNLRHRKYDLCLKQRQITFESSFFTIGLRNFVKSLKAFENLDITFLFMTDVKALFTRDISTHNITIKIKRYCDKKIILSHWCLKANQGKLLTKHRVTWFVVRQELTLTNRNRWLKIIFLSQYLFIAILCVKMSRVNKA